MADTTAATDTQLRALQDRVATAQRARVRAEHERDTANASAKTAAEALRTEFGVSTVDEAKTLLAGLEQELVTEMRALGDQLDQLAL